MQEDGRRSVEQHAGAVRLQRFWTHLTYKQLLRHKIVAFAFRMRREKTRESSAGSGLLTLRREHQALCDCLQIQTSQHLYEKKFCCARSIYLIINVFFLPFALSSTSGSLEELLQRQGGKLASFPETRRILPVKPLRENKSSLLSWKQIQKNNFLPLLAAFSQRTHWQHSRPPRSLERAHV